MSLGIIILVFIIVQCGYLLVTALGEDTSSLGKPYSLVLVGGGLMDDNAEVWNTIIELGGGKGFARFGVISAASENPCCDEDSSWVYYRDLLLSYGAAEVYYVPVTVDHKGNNSSPEVVRQVRSLTGFFFGGGDQLRIVDSFYNGDAGNIPSDVLTAIKETLYATGGVVAGTSAGTDCQTGSVMITGGESYLALRNGTQVRYDTKELPVSEVLTAYGSGGIGLFTDGLLDTHFANRGRHGRLVELLVDSRGLTTGHHRAIGIDENTALVVTGDWTQRRAAVIGQRGVWVFDTSAARRVTATATADKSSSVGRLLGLGFDPIEGVRLSRLSDGDRLDLGSFSLHHASYKTAIVPSNDVSVASSEDIFREDTFEFDKLLLSLLQSMARSTFGVTKQTNPQLSIRLQKEEGESSSSRGYGGINPTTGLYAYSFEGVLMSVDVAE